MRDRGYLRAGLCALLLATATAIPMHEARAQADTGRITLAQILEAPDDLELNLAYARQLIAAGEVQQAATVLERLLLQQPDWDAVRLTYGIVLYRLRDLAGAERELVLLADRGLDAERERRRLRYLRLSRGGTAKLRAFSTFTFGAKVSDNPGRAADDPALRPLADTDTHWGAVATARTRVEYDLDSGLGNILYAQSDGIALDYEGLDVADFAATRLRAGAKLFGSRTSWDVFVTGGAAYQHYERYLTSLGGGGEVAFEVGEGDRVRLFAGLSGVYEDYRTTDFSTIGSARDGWRVDGHVGARWRITDAHIVTAKASQARKNAESDAFSYDRTTLDLNYLGLLGEGVYVNAAASWSRLDYDSPDTRFSSTLAREDDEVRLRGAIGAPIETLLRDAEWTVPDAIGDIVVQAGATYKLQVSNFDSLDVREWSGDLLFIKRIQW